MKSEAHLTKRLVNLFLVTGELGTFCHRAYKICKLSYLLLCVDHLLCYSKMLRDFADGYSRLNLSVISCPRTNVGLRRPLFQSVLTATIAFYY